MKNALKFKTRQRGTPLPEPFEQQSPLRASRSNGRSSRIELSEHIVADPAICHGKPTFKGTRIMVWQILQDLEYGETMDQIVKGWGGRVTKSMIVETLRLAHSALLDEEGRLIRGKNRRLAA